MRGNNKITFDFFKKKKENLYLEIENFTQNKKLNLFKNIYFLKMKFKIKKNSIK